MGLVDIIQEIPDNAMHKKAAAAVLDYVIRKVPKNRKYYDEIVAELTAYRRGEFTRGLSYYAASGIPEIMRRKELPKKGGKLKKKVSRKIKRLGLEYLLFQLTTGIEAREQIKFNGEGVPGYNLLRGLATLISGKPTKTTPLTGKYFLALAKKHKMPLLTKEHRDYIANFTTEYVRQTPAERLGQDIHLGKGFSIWPGKPTYSPFLHQLSKQIVSQGPELQLELFWKWTGISSLEGITRSEYASLIGFASLLTGKRMDREKTKKYIRRLAS